MIYLMGFWSWLKGGFKHIGEAIVAFVKSSQVRDLLRSAEGAVVTAVVAELNQTNLSSSQKREEALRRIGSAFASQGKSVGSSVINLLLELAVNSLKNLGPK